MFVGIKKVDYSVDEVEINFTYLFIFILFHFFKCLIYSNFIISSSLLIISRNHPNQVKPR